MERDDSDATISDGSDLSLDVPMETSKKQKGYKGVLDTLKDMSLSLRRSEKRDMSPTYSGRERRSPSKVYEDSLIMERKIKSFGLFSEDLSWILMGLLKDNEELKNIIKVGFKEIEREMSEIDDSNRIETSERVKENLELKQMLNNKNNEVDERLNRIEHDVKSKHQNMKLQLHSTIEAFKEDVGRQIEDTISKKLPDLNENINDMNAKMSLAFKNQDDKVVNLKNLLDNNTEEINHLINKTNDDLNKAIESNYEDTTLAVITLRKDLSETIKEEANKTVQLKQEINSNIENLKEEFKKDVDKMKEVTDQNHEITERKHLEVLSKIGEGENSLKNVEQSLQTSLKDSKQDLQDAINILDLKQCEEFKNAKDALSNTIDQGSQDMEELRNKLMNQKSDLEDQINVSMTKMNNFEREINNKMINLENNELGSLKKTFFENIEKLDQKIDLSSNENKVLIGTEKSQLESTIGSVEKKTENNVKAIMDKLEEAIIKLSTHVSESKEEFKKSQEQSEKDFRELISRNEKENEMLKLKYSNERKGLELELKKDDTDYVSSENSLIDLLKVFQLKSEKIKMEASELFQKLIGNQDSLEKKLEGKHSTLQEEIKSFSEKQASELGLQKELMSQFVKEGQNDLNKKVQNLEDLGKQGKREDIIEIRKEMKIPLSLCFTAFKDDEYFGKGEENLKFSGCSLNTEDVMDPKSGVFTVPLSGLYLLTLTVCSQDKRKVLISIRRNGEELASLYDQNHVDNNANTMSSQVFITGLTKEDKISVYLYTNTGITDRKTNHFTQFSGLLLRPLE